MHIRSPGLWICFAAVAVVGLAGCQDSPGYDRRALLPGFSSPSVESWSRGLHSAWEFVPVRTYGAMEGPLAFGLVIAVAAGEDGVLAVADMMSCSITLVERPEGRFIRSIGRCGEGPAEFRQIRAMAFHGDSLLVYDQGRASIAILDSTGTEIGRTRAPGSGTSAIAAMDLLDDSTMLVSLERLNGEQSAASDVLELVGLLDIPTGEIREWVAADAPLSTVGPQRTIRRMTACLHRDRSTPLVALANSWSFEGIGIALPGRTEVFHFLSEVGMVPQQRDDGSWAPGNWWTGVWCGESGALFRMTKLGASVPRQASHPEETFFEMRSYDGSLLFRTSVTDSTSPLHSLVGAMLGDTLFVARGAPEGYPIITEFLLTGSR